jgi:hypothetical protein
MELFNSKALILTNLRDVRSSKEYVNVKGIAIMLQPINDLNVKAFLNKRFISAVGVSALALLLLFISLNLSAAEPLRLSAEQLQQNLNSPGLIC